MRPLKDWALVAWNMANNAPEPGADDPLGVHGVVPPTVTAFHIPGEAKRIQQRVEEDHDIVLATSLGDLADDILRVGHMGFNADVDKVDRVMDAIEAALD